MKTIFITENMYDILKENILLDNLPEDIVNVIFKNGTSLKNNPAIPTIFDDNFLERIVKKRFLETKENLKKIGKIDDFDDDKIESVLSKLLTKAQDIEQKNKNELEKICFNYVVDFFEIPEDSISFEINLTTDLSDNNISIEPNDIDIEFDNINDIEELKNEVSKKRLLNCISMGMGMCVSSYIKSYLSEIYDVDPRLPDLYRKILALNDYLLFVREDVGITDTDKKLLGFSEVRLGQPDEKPIVKSEGVIFPVLLSETIRGLMELFSSHGLPHDKDKLNYIISKTDYLKSEPWDMRIGPSLWTIITDCFGALESNLIPYLYKRISMLSTKNFNKLMSEVFAKTRKGKEMMNKVVAKARQDKEYVDFSEKMTTLQTDKNIINDEYIIAEEL